MISKNSQSKTINLSSINHCLSSPYQNFSIQSFKKPTQSLLNFYTQCIKNNPEGFIQKLHLMPSILDFAEQVQQNNGVFCEVFFNHNHLIGICALKKITSTQAEICKFHIDKDFQNQGIGSQVFDFILNLAKNIGIKKLTLHVSKSQKSAIYLYQKFGFSITEDKICIVELEGTKEEFPTLFMEKLL